MHSNKPLNNSSYLPVAWEYRESVEEEIKKQTFGKIFYFDDKKQLDQAEGRILQLFEQEREGVFIRLEQKKSDPDSLTVIRIDRIITLFGKIGAAYDEYDAFANACMDCKGD